jgi:SAM-dependent methyltransferase
MEWEVFGIDVSRSALRRIPRHGKIHTFVGDTCAQPFPGMYFDLITMWQTLEHMHNPFEVLKEACRILKPGGSIYVCVPNAGSIPARIFRDRWPGFDIPRHLYQFTPGVLRKLLVRAGFNVVAVRHLPYRSGIPESLRSLLLDKHRSSKVIETPLFRRVFFWISNLCAYLQWGEIILVQARKG